MEIQIGRRSQGLAVLDKAQVTDPSRITPSGLPIVPRPLVRIQPQQLRRWADMSEWVRAAINHRRIQVSQANWSIVPIDNDKPYSPEQQAAITLLFLRPNNRQKTFRSLIEPMIEDLLVLDKGVAEKEQNLKGLPIALHLVDGASIRFKPFWSGDPTDPRYEWWPRGSFMANLLDTQIIYLMGNPRSWSPEGFSLLEALKVTIEADLEAAQFNARNVRQTNPHGVLNLGENIGSTQVDSFKVYWDAEIAGRRNTAIMGGAKSPQFISLGPSAREMQYMQWQVYLLRKIAAVFGIAPQDLGITFDVNRANATHQQELSEDRGLKPLLRLVEENMNGQVVADFARQQAKSMYHRGEIDMQTLRLAVALTHVNPRDHADVFKKLPNANIMNLTFKFQLKTSKAARDLADLGKASLAGVPWETVNEFRAEDGRDPVEGGDEIIVQTPVGPMTLSDIAGFVPVTGGQPADGDGGDGNPDGEKPKGAEAEMQQEMRRLRRLARREYIKMLFEDTELVPRQPVTILDPPEVRTIIQEVEVDEDGEPVDD